MKDKVRGKTEEIKGKARQKVGSVKEAAKSIAYDVEHARKQTKSRV